MDSYFVICPGENFDEVLYGTSDGKVGLVQLSRDSPSHRWEIPNKDKAGGKLHALNYHHHHQHHCHRHRHRHSHCHSHRHRHRHHIMRDATYLLNLKLVKLDQAHIPTQS